MPLWSAWRIFSLRYAIITATDYQGDVLMAIVTDSGVSVHNKPQQQIFAAKVPWGNRRRPAPTAPGARARPQSRPGGDRHGVFKIPRLHGFGVLTPWQNNAQEQARLRIVPRNGRLNETWICFLLVIRWVRRNFSLILIKGLEE